MLCFLLMLSFTISKAQDPIQLKLGEHFKQNVITIKFEDVLFDSRCPKGVHCIWAGEVVVLFTILKNDKKLEQKKITLNSTSKLQNVVGNLYVSEDINLTGFNVSSYPGTNAKIDKKIIG